MSPILFLEPSTLRMTLGVSNVSVGNLNQLASSGLTKLLVAPLSISACTSALKYHVFNLTIALIDLCFGTKTSRLKIARMSAASFKLPENPLLTSSFL